MTTQSEATGRHLLLLQCDSVAGSSKKQIPRFAREDNLNGL